MKKIAIGIALANTHGAVDTEEVFTFIESHEGDFETYKLAPPPLGSIRAAALDYMILLNIVGSAASIASFLWMAYDKFIAQKKNKDDNTGIVVVIRKDDGTNEQFWIGHTDKSKEIFIKTFSEKVDTIRHSELPGQSTEHAIKEIETKSIWIRRR
jgi:hypothetical protein